MSVGYGWTYAHRHAGNLKPVKRNRYRGRRQEKTLAVHAAGAVRRRGIPNPTARPGLDQTGRVLVALALVAITVLVLGRQSAWQQQLSGQLAAWWETLRPAAAPAASAAEVKPTPAPASATASGTEAEAINVVRDDRRINRTPVALLSDSALFCMNAEGQVWPLAPRSGAPDLPVITGPTVREVPAEMGIRLKTDLDLEQVRLILGSPLAPELSEIHLGSPAGATLYTREGVKILLPAGPSVAVALGRLEAVFQDIRRRGQAASMIDLRYDQHVVVRPGMGK